MFLLDLTKNKKITLTIFILSSYKKNKKNQNDYGEHPKEDMIFGWSK
jgi:hypothetical protein